MFKNKKKANEKKFTIELVALACIGLSFFVYDICREWDYVPKVVLSQEQATEKAKDFLQNSYLTDSIEDYSYSIEFINDDEAHSLLAKTFGEKQAFEYLRDNNLPVLEYSIRFFQELEKEEFLVNVDASNGNIISFLQAISEDQERGQMSELEARAFARSFLEEEGLDLNKIEERDFSLDQKEKRRDYEFTFRFKDSNIPTEFGDMHQELWVSVLGDKIGGFVSYFFVPEDFGRVVNGEMGNGMLIAALSFLASALMIVLCLVVLAQQYKRSNLNKKLFFYISGFIFIILFFENINFIPLIKSAYETDISFLVFWGLSFIIPIIAIIFTTTLVFISGASGEALAREVWPRKIKFLSSLGEKVFSREMSQSILKGYLIAFILLGITAFIYFIGEKYLGVWSLLSLGGAYGISLSFVPAFSIFAGVGMLAAISEEFLYRLFGISFFKKKFKRLGKSKSTILAIIIITIIWAVAHSTYPVFPFYFRAIELLIGGAIFGYFFVRYNIATTITAHYVFNTSISLPVLLLGGSTTQFIAGIFVVALPGMVLLRDVYNRFYRK